ncbi:hypothetical protein ACFYOK_08765 [Microbispora bryophytorum]|uniref:hypothetical protein n=1 Tax=Microbispora bryophytorum TaxID=1460882 RepID=UPI0033F7C431
MTSRTRSRTAADRGPTCLPDRARRLVETLGGRFSREMGIDVDRGDREVERWLLAATLFGTRISAAIAVRTYRAMAEAGVRGISDVEGRTWEELVEILDGGDYARYYYRTATRLLRLAESGVDPPPDDRALEAGRHAGLFGAGHHPLDRLQEIAGEAGLDVRDLEAALVRLWLAHHKDFSHCPGSARCAVLTEEG